MCFTFKHIWYAALEIDERWEIMYAILFGNREILGFHKGDAMPITIVVDVLQFLQNAGALLTIVRI